MRVSGKKISLWVGIVAFLAAMFGFFGYYAFVSSHRTTAYQDAEKAFEVGNLPFAVKMAHLVLKGDPHHLPTIQLLAEIAVADGHPEREMYWRQRALQENPLDAGIRERALRSMLRMRDFEKLKLELGDGKKDGGDWPAWRAYAIFTSGHHDEAAAAAKSLDQKDEPARFVRAVCGLEKAELFADFTNSPSAEVRLEAALGQGAIGERTGDYAMAETMYALATNLNLDASAPYCAQFLARRGRFREATDILAPHVKKFQRPDLAIAAAEFLAMQYRPEEIRSIAEMYPTRDLTSMSVAGYFDALAAFAANDILGAAESLKSASGKIKTPFSVFIRIHADIAADDAELIYADWLELLGYPEDFNLQLLAGSAIKAWVGDSFKRGVSPVKLGPISEALQRNGRFDLELQRVVLLGKLLNGTLIISELDDLRRKYPDDKALGKIREWWEKMKK